MQMGNEGGGKRSRRWRCCLTALLALAGVIILPARAADSIKANDFGNMTIEELMQVPLSISRTDTRLSQSPAAAYVITSEDIRRSGATSIPEALRGAPGIEVARVDQHSWAVTARGFNDTFANKLLVMIDGRTVYTPLFSGVFWDVQDTVLDDIDRIEIVRGPGSTLWGANAVNGVINIVTKTAAQTQGGLISAGAGTGEIGFGSVRYGGRITDDIHYRVYMKYFDRDDTKLPAHSEDGDWQMLRGGFRVDWVPNLIYENASLPLNELTLQGDIYSGDVDQFFHTTVAAPAGLQDVLVRDVQQMDGGNILGRWTHRFSDDADFRVQSYYDRTHRSLSIFAEQRDTFDIDFQNQFKLGRRNAIIWGIGYRVTQDSTTPTPTVTLDPDSRTLNLFSGFLQDEITLVPDTLRLTLGSKLEHNDFTGWEVQPGVRLLWTPTTNQSVWASITRAVRTPSRAEDDIRVSTVVPPGIPVALLGDRRIESEKLLAYEIGYRVQPRTDVSFDTALFYNDYAELRTLDFVQFPPLAYFAAQRAGNRMHGETYGAELAADWQALNWWRWRGSYTFLELQLHRNHNSNNPDNESLERQSPNHQFSLRSSMDLPGNLEFDVGVRYVDSLGALSVPSYFTLDARLAWHPMHNFEIALVGQNLLEDSHAEFKPTTIRSLPVEVERSVYGKLTWKF